ncbi:unnamed protein product [Vitrella brassicaformis CCMP3155]|uniref:Uncharacterized protein n=1 Tax=Vitrella brassicaformis (strain CCMP3155) TaxID=1169540 RepID=A0A0G4ED78_VITBC|nr:unnamed protein product [Vitrella brassicaformis CCMP3155]|eukprot:CEL93296.1 unnamed protein product [Vitrella brassicaformis CCMP3155]
MDATAPLVTLVLIVSTSLIATLVCDARQQLHSAALSPSARHPLASWLPKGKSLSSMGRRVLPRLRKKFSSRPMDERLSSVPVFLITNSYALPYLTQVRPGEQTALMFTDPEEANTMLNEMVQTAGPGADARLFVISLEKAWAYARRAEPRRTGIVGEDGKEAVMTFKFHPPQVENAGNYVTLLGRRTKMIPVFEATGLDVTKNGDKLCPLFMDLEDLEAAWERMHRARPDTPPKPKVSVYNLLDVLLHRERQANGLGPWGIVPSSKALDFVKKNRSGGTRKARMIRIRR